MNDTQKFSENINNLEWNDGIADDVLKTVLSYFSPAEDSVRGLVPRVSHSSTPSLKASTAPRTSSPGKISSLTLPLHS